MGLVAELTGFHRVMIYRFDNHKNGCVVSELIDPEASDDLFRGEQKVIIGILKSNAPSRDALSSL